MPDSLDRRHFVAGGLTLIGGLIGSGCGGGGGGGGTPSVDPGLTEPIGTATLSPDVVYFPETTPVTFRTTGDNIVEVTGPTPGLAVGKLLLITTGNGFAGRITSIQTTSTGVRCVYETVTFDDIFSEADFTYSGDVPGTAVVFTEADPIGTTLTRAAPYSKPTRASISRTLSGGCTLKWPGKTQTAALETKMAITVTFEVSFRKDKATNELLFRYCPSIRVDGTQTLSLDTPDKDGNDKVDLGTFGKRWKRFTATITTPVPLGPLSPILKIKWLLAGELSTSASLSADVKCVAGLDWNAEVKGGAEYSSLSGWKEIDEFTGDFTPKIPRMQGVLEGEVSALDLKLSAYAMGIVGPTVTLRALQSSLDAEYVFPNFADRGYGNWTFDISSGVEGGIGFRGWLSKYIDDLTVDASLTWFEREYKIPDTGVINGTIN